VRTAESAPPETYDTEQEDAEALIGFPSLSISRIRWHPDPDRRTAVVERPGGIELEIREGDIVDGVLVRRIEPSALEFSVGSTRRRITLTP
jgi:hypothetical protein